MAASVVLFLSFVCVSTLHFARNILHYMANNIVLICCEVPYLLGYKKVFHLGLEFGNRELENLIKLIKSESSTARSLLLHNN